MKDTKKADKTPHKPFKAAETKENGHGSEKRSGNQPGSGVDAREAEDRYTACIRSLRIREIAAYLLCTLMAILLLTQNIKLSVPELLRDPKTIGISMLGMHIAVLVLGFDVMIGGVTELITLRPGRDTLILLTNLVALADGLSMKSFSGSPWGYPYCAAASLVMAFAISGKRLIQLAMKYGVRTMKSAAVPTVINGASGLADEGKVVVKRLGTYRGFVARMKLDPVERIFRVLTPVILIMTAVMALLLYLKNGTEGLLHSAAGILIAAATVFASVCYSRPFKKAAKRLAASGSVVAGLSGAGEIADTVGIIVRDEDVFPENTISISGMKIVSGCSVERAVSYAGSLVITSGCGLRRAFDELMRQYAAPMCRVDHFIYDSEGGVSGSILGERVLVGTHAYMERRHVAIPEEIRIDGAAYVAIDKELCGVFAVEYRYLEPIGTALKELINGRLTPVLAFRDFNITANSLNKGFRLGSAVSELLPAGDRYKLSVESDTGKTAAAIMTREGVGHYINIVRNARKLTGSVRRSIIMLFLGSFGGAAILFFSFLAGAFEAASAWNLLVYILLWAAASMLFADNASDK